MSEPLSPEDFLGPHGLPFLGNIRDIDIALPFDGLMSLAREHGAMPTPWRLVFAPHSYWCSG